MHDKEGFNDDLENDDARDKEETLEGNNSNLLQTKWNEIQEEYISKHPGLDINDLYFEGGGFNGMLEKIAEILGKSVEDVKKEIENW